MGQVIGLDIGGANLKASDGLDRTIDTPFPMWQRVGELTSALRSLTSVWGDDIDEIAVTMTGELADCFRTRAEGVNQILTAVEDAFPRSIVRVWQTCGEFVHPDEARDCPVLTAAANWHALATFAARVCLQGESLLMDIGSTTTDLIRIRNGTPLTEGLTDLMRLQQGELVYTGVRRTPLCAVAATVPWRGIPTPLAAEWFATTRDLYLWTGEIAESPDDHDTANARPATRECARDRLTRTVCSDSDELDDSAVTTLVQSLIASQKQQIRTALERVMVRLEGPLRAVIFAGEGERLARQIVTEIPELQAAERFSLGQLLGECHSRGACAYALARLATERI